MLALLSAALCSNSCCPRLPLFLRSLWLEQSNSTDSFSPSRSMSQDLSEILKEATKEVHEQAENTPFMKNFQKGQVSLHEFKVGCNSTAQLLGDCALVTVTCS